MPVDCLMNLSLKIFPKTVLLKVGSADYLHQIPRSIPNLQTLGAELMSVHLVRFLEESLG